MALAAMDSESGCLPLDYLQGHKDGLEWAARLAEANHHDTGDWLYDDPIELAKAIRKGPDILPVQPVADSEPDRNPVLAYADSYRDMAKQGVESVPIWSVITDLERNIAPLYRHAQPVPLVPDKNGLLPCPFCGGEPEEDAGGCSEFHGHEHQDYSITCKQCGAEVYCSVGTFEKADVPCSCHHDTRKVCVDKWNRRAAMLASAPQPQNAPQNIPEIIPGWIPVSERMPIEFQAVIAFDGDKAYGEAMYSSDDGFTIDGYEPCDRVQLQNVTHWMPLPAAPQEVRGE
ncbi:TPA: DUF551 domain-containing protein [Klebsiella pneumoniae]